MIRKHLKESFGFNELLPGQEEVIDLLVRGESAVAIFPTGGGKSLCYQLPALILENLTLVVSPLLSLMKDQIDFLKKKNLPAAKIDSSMDREELNSTIEKAKNGELKILMISVERFRNERFRVHLKDMKISLLVVDEANCISEWGHNFRPDYLKLPDYRREYQIVQSLLLTATATPVVIEDMCREFGINRSNVVLTGFYRKNLYLTVTPCDGEERDKRLLDLIKKSPEEPTIVYVTLQKTAEKVAAFLNDNGIEALHYHAGMQNEDRIEVQNRFMGNRVSVIVATIAFGMGIDKRDIRRIIHYNLPKSLENYSQEIGRAGRDGKTSYCEVLAGRDNISVLENFIYGDTPEISNIKIVLNAIAGNLGKLWEVKVTSLSQESDIRSLPLKTLLVYLEIAGLIKPRYTYFEDYTFKYLINERDILDKLKTFNRGVVGFAEKIFDNVVTKKVWSSVDIGEVVNSSGAPRSRVVKALEYFDQNRWIELHSKQSVEVYEILKRDFILEEEGAKLAQLFSKKERAEISRIGNMVKFFESGDCLSSKLSLYFGENNIKECNHCSVCRSGEASVLPELLKKDLRFFNYGTVTEDILKVMGDKLTPHMATKFLCGIISPVLSKNCAKSLKHFGVLENYPFKDVHEWVLKNSSFT